jgi:hypothetical protein
LAARQIATPQVGELSVGSRIDADFDVFAGDELVGRIYRLNAATEAWWWGVAFDLTGRESYGYADSLDEAKAAFRAEYDSR